jgi:hypothetical protein
LLLLSNVSNPFGADAVTTPVNTTSATRNVHLAFGLILLAWIIFVAAFSWVSWQVEKRE